MNSQNKAQLNLSSRWKLILGIGMALGVIGLILGLIASIVDLWLWLIVSFLYLGGIAFGMLGWAAIFRASLTRWTPAVNRLGHSAIFFIPVIFVLLIFLLAGASAYMPWIRHPFPEKVEWLNLPFLVIREILAVGAVSALFFFLVRRTLIADRKAGVDISDEEQHRMNRLGVAAIIVYSFGLSVVALDFIMSLDPIWVSTMLPPYYFVTNLYVAMAVLILLGILLRSQLGIESYLGADQFHDMGNLLLGFALFSMGLFFAQYLTIWYADLPMETGFLIRRYLKGSWPPLGWIAFVVGYGIPFVMLIPKQSKMNLRWLTLASVLAVVGVALERYVLVVPSILPHRLMASPLSGLVFIGLACAFIASLLLFLKRYSPVSTAEAALYPAESVETSL